MFCRYIVKQVKHIYQNIHKKKTWKHHLVRIELFHPKEHTPQDIQQDSRNIWICFLKVHVFGQDFLFCFYGLHITRETFAVHEEVVEDQDALSLGLAGSHGTMATRQHLQIIWIDNFHRNPLRNNIFKHRDAYFTICDVMDLGHF